MDCIIVDIDGTIADLRHRLHHIKNGNHNWDAFFKEVGQDTPIWPVIHVIEAYALDQNLEIVIVSGRSDVCREETSEWLNHYIGHIRLYMRKEGDYRKDSVVKQEILDQILSEGFNPVAAFDDRDSIARVWRDRGIFTFVVSDWEQRQPKNPAKATLHIMVGPSGAGKTSYALEHFNRDSIVSSDSIREQMTGDAADQSMNDQVFTAFHDIIRTRLENGLDTVADATNLRRKDRLAVVELANGGDVVYHVINRSMDEKIKDGGWRNDVKGLMERHEQRFQSQLKDIFKEGLRDNISIQDNRK